MTMAKNVWLQHVLGRMEYRDWVLLETPNQPWRSGAPPRCAFFQYGDLMETGYGIEPKTNLAQLPNGVEARGRRQPTKPV